MSEKKKSEAKQPEVILQFAEWEPTNLTSTQVLDKVRGALAQIATDAKLAVNSTTRDLGGRIIMFGMMGGYGPGVQKILSGLGCNLVEGTDDINVLYERLRTVPVRMVIFEYNYDRKTCISTMEEILEAREIPRVAMCVICPGKDMIDEFNSKAKHLFVEAVFQIPDSRNQFGNILIEALRKVDDMKSPRTALERIRDYSRILATGAKGKLAGAEYDQLLQQLGMAPGKDFWHKIETAVWDIMQKKTANIGPQIDQLAALSPNSLLVQLTKCSVQGKTEGEKATLGLIEFLRTEKQVNVDKMFRVGRFLLRRKNIEGLAHFLNYWFTHKKLDKDHQFSYFVGCYYQLKGDAKKAAPHFRYAVFFSPLRTIYMEALLQNVTLERDFRAVEDVCELAKQFSGVNTLHLRIAQTRAAYGLRKIRIADGELAKLLTDFPTNTEVLAMKREFLDTRVSKAS